MKTSLENCGSAACSDKATAYFQPRFHVNKTDVDTVVQVELPGVSRDNLQLTVENNELILEAKAAVGTPDSWKALHRESSIRAYRLRLLLGEMVNQASIAANLEDGILTLIFPKVAEAKPRKITVK